MNVPSSADNSSNSLDFSDMLNMAEDFDGSGPVPPGSPSADRPEGDRPVPAAPDMAGDRPARPAVPADARAAGQNGSAAVHGRPDVAGSSAPGNGAAGRSAPRPATGLAQEASSGSPADTPSAAAANESGGAPTANRSDESAKPVVDEQDEQFLRVKCACGRVLRVRPANSGKKIRCPQCRKPVPVPADVASAAESDSRQSSQEPNVDPRFGQIAADIEAALEAAQAEIASSGRKSPKPIRTLGRSRLKQITQRLAESDASKPSEVEDVRNLLDELGQSRDHRAADLIAGQLEATSEKVREAAVVALANLGEPRLIPHAVRRLSDESSRVRRAAVKTLGVLGTRHVVKPLLVFGLIDPHLKFPASEAIVGLREEAVPALLELVDDREDGAALEAVVLLGRLKAGKAVAVLMQVIDTRSAIFRAHAAEALGLIGEDRTVGCLLRLLKDDDPGVRINAVVALARVPDPQSVKPLVRLLRDPDQDLRMRAVTTLGEIGDRQATVPLYTLLESESPELVPVVAEALGKIGDPRALEHLLRLLPDADKPLLLRVLASLRKISDPAAADALLPYLDNSDTEIRQRAVESIGRIGDSVSASKLEKLAKRDSSEAIRAAAVKALGEIGDVASLSTLEEALSDAFPVKCQAINALGQVGDPSVLPALLAMSREVVPEIRFHVASALGCIDHENARNALEELLCDEDALVRRTAARSLVRLGDERGEQLLQDVEKSRPRKKRRSVSSVSWSLAPSMIVGLFSPNSPQGKIALASLGGVLLLAGLAFALFSDSGPELVIPRGKTASVALSPDGKYMLTGRTTRLIEVWDVESGKRIKRAATGGADGVTFAGTGGKTILALQGAEGILWDHETEPAPARTVAAHKAPVEQMVTSSNQTFAATIDREGTVIIWNLAQAAPTSALALPIAGGGIALNDEGTQLAGQTGSGELVVWSTSDGAELKRMPGARNAPRAMTFCNGGRMLAMSVGNKVRCIELETGNTAWEAETGNVSHLRVHPQTGQLLAIERSKLQWRDPDSGESQSELPLSLPGGIHFADLSADGKRLAFGDEESTAVWIVDAATGKLVKTLTMR